MELDAFIEDLRKLIAEAEGIPDRVKQYARGIEKTQNGKKGHKKYSPGQAYATAWSRFCKYHDPNSPHCQKKTSRYFSH